VWASSGVRDEELVVSGTPVSNGGGTDGSEPVRKRRTTRRTTTMRASRRVGGAGAIEGKEKGDRRRETLFDGKG